MAKDSRPKLEIRHADLRNVEGVVELSRRVYPEEAPYTRGQVAAEASENVEMIIVADLNLATVQWARAQGSVRNLRDRRFDLYRTRWSDGG